MNLLRFLEFYIIEKKFVDMLIWEINKDFGKNFIMNYKL